MNPSMFRFLVSSNCPFRAVDNPEFQAYVNLLRPSKRVLGFCFWLRNHSPRFFLVGNEARYLDVSLRSGVEEGALPGSIFDGFHFLVWGRAPIILPKAPLFSRFSCNSPIAAVAGSCSDKVESSSARTNSCISWAREARGPRRVRADAALSVRAVFIDSTPPEQSPTLSITVSLGNPKAAAVTPLQYLLLTSAGCSVGACASRLLMSDATIWRASLLIARRHHRQTVGGTRPLWPRYLGSILIFATAAVSSSNSAVGPRAAEDNGEAQVEKSPHPGMDEDVRWAFGRVWYRCLHRDNKPRLPEKLETSQSAV